MSPVLARKCVESHQPIPIPKQCFYDLLVGLVVCSHKDIAPALAFTLPLSVRHCFQPFSCLARHRFRQIIENIRDLVVPAPLFRSGLVNFAESRPDAEVPITDREPRKLQPAAFEIPEETVKRERGSPNPIRFSICPGFWT